MGIMSVSWWVGLQGCYANCLCLAFMFLFLPIAKCIEACTWWAVVWKFGYVKSCGWHNGKKKKSNYSACHHSQRASLQSDAYRRM